MSGVSAYLMLMDGESLRRIGKGSGLDLVAAAKSWIARHALCAREGAGKGLGRAGLEGLANGLAMVLESFQMEHLTPSCESQARLIHLMFAPDEPCGCGSSGQSI